MTFMCPTHLAYFSPDDRTSHAFCDRAVPLTQSVAYLRMYLQSLSNDASARLTQLAHDSTELLVLLRRLSAHTGQLMAQLNTIMPNEPVPAPLLEGVRQFRDAEPYTTTLITFVFSKL